MLARAGHDVVGLDTDLDRRSTFGPWRETAIHLAAESHDPLGDLNPQLTYDINHLASVRVATLAKEAGVARFAFASLQGEPPKISRRRSPHRLDPHRRCRFLHLAGGDRRDRRLDSGNRIG
jgi:nucleoside-diphosphate-sugar epimerase